MIRNDKSEDKLDKMEGKRMRQEKTKDFKDVGEEDRTNITARRQVMKKYDGKKEKQKMQKQKIELECCLESSSQSEKLVES